MSLWRTQETVLVIFSLKIVMVIVVNNGDNDNNNNNNNGDDDDLYKNYLFPKWMIEQESLMSSAGIASTRLWDWLALIVGSITESMMMTMMMTIIMNIMVMVWMKSWSGSWYIASAGLGWWPKHAEEIDN